MRTVAFTLTAAALSAVLVGCSASTAGTPSGTAASTASPPAASASESTSRQAWVRGTNVTLTNSTGSAVEIKTYTHSGGEGTYAPLAAGASTSATSTWSVAASEVIFTIKRPSGGVVALWLLNPSVGYPSTHVCEASSSTGCTTADQAAAFNGYLAYDENQTQTANTAGGAASFTVTRNADDEDNKNWTVSLTSIS